MDEMLVLHVEDDPDIRLIVEIALCLDRHIRIRSVGDGAAALDMFTADAAFAPDLVLSDYLLPDMTGEIFAGRLRNIPRLAATPLVFLTALAGQADRDRLMAAGAAGVVTKPFDPLTLPSDLRQMLQAYAAPSG